jgi:hypothetical protein
MTGVFCVAEKERTCSDSDLAGGSENKADVRRVVVAAATGIVCASNVNVMLSVASCCP